MPSNTPASKSVVFGALTSTRIELGYPEDYYLVDMTGDNPIIVKTELAIGVHIPRTLDQMLDVLKSLHISCRMLNPEVRFTVEANGVEVEIRHTMAKGEPTAQFHAKQEKRAAEYKASPEYAELVKRRHEKALADQNRVQELLSLLDSIITDEIKLAPWLAEFALLNDSMEIRFDKKALVAKLEGAGYVSGEFVGVAPQDFDDNMKFRWAVGQAISMMKGGMPIHPALSDRFLCIQPQKPALGKNPFATETKED